MECANGNPDSCLSRIPSETGKVYGIHTIKERTPRGGRPFCVEGLSAGTAGIAVADVAAAAGIAVADIAAAAGVVAGHIAALAIAAGREERGDRELDPAEQIAGALVGGAAGGGAVLGGDAVAEAGDPQLGIPLETNDGELAQGDIEPAALTGEHQFAVEAAADEGGKIQADVVVAVAVAHIDDFAGQNHGIHHFHHGLGGAAAHELLAVKSVGYDLAAEDLGAAFAAAEDNPLGEDGQAADGAGPGAADDGVHQDTIVVSNIDGIVTGVELHGLDVNGDVQEFCTAGLDSGGLLQHGLGIMGQEDPQILDAILVKT